MLISSSPLLNACLILAAHASAQVIDSALVGTWTSKSGKVITGSGFYDPATDSFYEPELAGISYSFTADGHYEEALFRAIPNPTDPSCPSGMIQWQHGTIVDSDPTGMNGTLKLTPISIDGRQLMSEPCLYQNSVLSYYNQPETFSKYEVLMDNYVQRMRLNLYQWDGTPVNPMWLAYNPPTMLPTTTLHVATGTAVPHHSKRAAGSIKAGRSITPPPPKKVEKNGYAMSKVVLWLGMMMTAAGGVLLIWF